MVEPCSRRQKARADKSRVCSRYADLNALRGRNRAVLDCSKRDAGGTDREAGRGGRVRSAAAAAAAGGERYRKRYAQRLCAATGATDHTASLLPWRRMKSIRRQAPFSVRRVLVNTRR